MTTSTQSTETTTANWKREKAEKGWRYDLAPDYEMDKAFLCPLCRRPLMHGGTLYGHLKSEPVVMHSQYLCYNGMLAGSFGNTERCRFPGYDADDPFLLATYRKEQERKAAQKAERKKRTTTKSGSLDDFITS